MLNCLIGRAKENCEGSGWAYERLIGYALTNFERKKFLSRSREDCMEKCFIETEFECRSVNYNDKTDECSLSDMDRHTIPSDIARQRYFINSSKEFDYIENNCIQGTY